MKIERVTVRQGYDLWAATYDETPNPVVAMDARHTLRLLAPQPGERILDAGCGTGRNLSALLDAGCAPVGMDFSPGMLSVARRRFPAVPLVCADLQRGFPFTSDFAAVLCALIGEHLDDLPTVFGEVYAGLQPRGRFVFSVYHPALAAAGKEANFQRGEVEYRLGAVRHTTDDYLTLLRAAGFDDPVIHEFNSDAALAAAVPAARKYLDFPVLLVLVARK